MADTEEKLPWRIGKVTKSIDEIPMEIEEVPEAGRFKEMVDANKWIHSNGDENAILASFRIGAGYETEMVAKVRKVDAL